MGLQNKQSLLLRSKSVLLIGLGGLGCPTALELAGLGIGRLVLMDPDKVEAENLHRQILYDPNDIGQAKTEVMARSLKKNFPNLAVEQKKCLFSAAGHSDLVDEVDLVVEGSDDGKNKLVLNEICVRRQKPAVVGGAIGYGGQVFVVPPGGRPCMACLFGNDIQTDLLDTCENAGILGPVTGVVGSWMARLASGLLEGETHGGILIFEGRRLRQRWRSPRVQQDCPVCSARAMIPKA